MLMKSQSALHLYAPHPVPKSLGDAVGDIARLSQEREGTFISTLAGCGILCARSGYTFLAPTRVVGDAASSGPELLAWLAGATAPREQRRRDPLVGKLRAYVTALEQSLDSSGRQEKASTVRFRMAATGGCFDSLHAGHKTFLSHVQSLCDELVVFLNTDRSVRALKGTGRPRVPLHQRVADVRQILRPQDSVHTFAVRTAKRRLSDCAPEIFIKGVDYWLRTVPEARRARPPIPVLIVDSIIEMHTSELHEQTQ